MASMKRRLRSEASGRAYRGEYNKLLCPQADRRQAGTHFNEISLVRNDGDGLARKHGVSSELCKLSCSLGNERRLGSINDKLF